MVTAPATKTTARVSRRKCCSGTRGATATPARLPATAPGTQRTHAGQSARVEIPPVAVRTPRPIVFEMTKYAARSAISATGGRRSRVSRRAGATPFSEVTAPRKPPAKPAPRTAPGTGRGAAPPPLRRSPRRPHEEHGERHHEHADRDLDRPRVDARERPRAEVEPRDAAGDEQRRPRPGDVVAEAPRNGNARHEREGEVRRHDEGQREAAQHEERCRNESVAEPRRTTERSRERDDDTSDEQVDRERSLRAGVRHGPRP
jgi:hypothetical protein